MSSGPRDSSRSGPRHAVFRQRYGPAAIVTGAGQGIGRAFAEALARRGLSVFLLDVQAELVERAAAEIEAAHAVSATPVVVDLARRDFIGPVEEAIGTQEIGLLVCNAAIGLEGPFLEETLSALHASVEVNCHAALTLAHCYGGRMVARGSGGVVLIASGTALHGSPGYAGYAATKAFNLVLGESLYYEWKDMGVDVLSFVPGPTNTPGLRKSVPGLAAGVEVGPIRLPGVTAEAAIAALGKRASAARRRDHANRLAARRRAAEAAIERSSSASRRARPDHEKSEETP